MFKTVIVVSCILAIALATPLPINGVAGIPSPVLNKKVDVATDEKAVVVATEEKKTDKRSIGAYYDVAPAYSYHSVPLTSYHSVPYSTYHSVPVSSYVSAPVQYYSPSYYRAAPSYYSHGHGYNSYPYNSYSSFY